MQKPITLLFLLICTLTIQAQPGYYFHRFEPPLDNYRSWFTLDTTHHNNSWQIGKPQKIKFDSAYSVPNAMVTDTINTYPINDTSIFYLKVVTLDRNLNNEMARVIGMRYKLYKDSGETATIEILADSGRQWIDVIKEAKTYDIDISYSYDSISGAYMYSKSYIKPTDNTEWTMLFIDLNRWMTYSNDLFPNKIPNYYPYSVNFDTTWLRFTFISDSIETNKAGWLIDDIGIQPTTVSVKHIMQKNKLISLYPNPTHNHIYIKRHSNHTKNESVTIYNLYGQKVLYRNQIPLSGYIPISLPSGLYTVKYTTDKEFAVKQLVVQ